MGRRKGNEELSGLIEEVLRTVYGASWSDRQKKLGETTFKKTEQLLYYYKTLTEHLESEKDYIDMIYKKRSCSVVRYTKNRQDVIDMDVITKERVESYRRSCKDVERVTKALESIQNKKGYEVIVLRYLQRKEDGTVFTFEEIAEKLSKHKNYNNMLSEKTVRNYKNRLIKEMAVRLFGSDAM